MTGLVHSRTVKLDAEHSEFVRGFIGQMKILSEECDRFRLTSRKPKPIELLRMLEEQKQGIVKLVTYLGDRLSGGENAS